MNHRVLTAFRRRTGLPLIVAVAGLSIANAAAAQDSASGGRFFEQGQIDFWHDKPEENDRGAPSRPGTLWQEGLVAADGRVFSYAPPKVLADLLDEPSQENARKYLDWQRERLARIFKAQQAIERIKAESPRNASLRSPTFAARSLSPESFQPTEPEGMADTPDWKEIELVYFFMPTCPACQKQDAELKKLASLNPSAAVTRVDVSARPELATAFAVRVTPTILVKIKSRSGSIRLERVATTEQINQAALALFKEPVK